MNLTLFIFSLVFSVAAVAQDIHDKKLQSKNFDQEGLRCGLKNFSVETYDYEFKNLSGKRDITRGSMMSAMWETTDLSCTRNYGVVQFIRGCIYDVEHNPKTKENKKYFGHGRESRGEHINFSHPQWEVDSFDIDPLYSSYSGEDSQDANRFAWHRSPNSSYNGDGLLLFESEYYDYLQDEPLKTPRLFVSDIPTASAFRPKGALGMDWINVSSLEFKTCLYNIKDIPLTGDPASFDVKESDGGPIVCFDWSDKMAVDYKNKILKRTEEMDSFCGVKN